jgi:hypothetical protein
MSLGPAQIRSLVESVSIGALASQTQVLIKELERINEVEHSSEACQVRNVLLCWPRYILKELEEIQASAPLGVTGSAAVRVRAFGEVLHEVFSFIRYLRAPVRK